MINSTNRPDMEFRRLIQEARGRDLLTHAELAQQQDEHLSQEQRRRELVDQAALSELQDAWSVVQQELTSIQPTAEPYIMVRDVFRTKPLEYEKIHIKHTDSDRIKARKAARKNAIADSTAIPAWDMMSWFTIPESSDGGGADARQFSMHFGANGVIYLGLNSFPHAAQTERGTHVSLFRTYKSPNEVPGIWVPNRGRYEVNNRAEVLQGLANLAVKHSLPISKRDQPKTLRKEGASRQPTDAGTPLRGPTPQHRSLGDFSQEEIDRIIAELNQ